MRKRRRRWDLSQQMLEKADIFIRIPGARKVHQAKGPDLPIHHCAEDHSSIDLGMLILGTAILDESCLHECSLVLSQELVRL